MKDNAPRPPDVSSPLMVAEDAIESNGYPIIDVPDDTRIVAFAIPNHLGGECEAVVEYLPAVGILQITTSLVRGHVQTALVNGLLRLLNGLNLMFPATSFTFDPSEEEGDEIDIALTCFVFDEKELTRDVTLMIVYLEQVLKATLPPIYEYVSQKLIYSINSDGTVISVRPRLLVDDCLAMIETGQFGRA